MSQIRSVQERKLFNFSKNPSLLKSPEKKFKEGRFSKEKYQQLALGIKIETPKIDEEAELNKQRGVSIFNQMQKEYENYDLELLLIEKGVDYTNTRKSANYLPLDMFDDKLYEEFSNESIMGLNMDIFGTALECFGRALQKAGDGIFVWRDIEILSYNKEIDKFTVKYLDSEADVVLPKIHIWFNYEDPRKFSKRVAQAHRLRTFADSIIRYNYYVENMPVQDGYDLDVEKRKKLERIAVSSSKDLEGLDTTSLILEVNQEYIKTLNSIIFDKYLSDNTTDLIPHNLVLPENGMPEAPYYGLLPLERLKGVKDKFMHTHNEVFTTEPKDFNGVFQEFCLATLYSKDEVIRSMQDIHKECNKVKDMLLFNTSIRKALRLEEFKALQESATTTVSNNLKGNWINELVRVIRDNFSPIEKGWFSLKDNHKHNYEIGKLKRFLMLLKLLMEDSILVLMQKSCKLYLEFLSNLTPIEVNIESAQKVTNIYQNHNEILPMPLFAIDILKSPSDDEFVYSTNPRNFVGAILNQFDRVVDDISKVPDIEARTLIEVYKLNFKKEGFTKAPFRPREKPEGAEIEDKEDKKNLIENFWLWEIFVKIRDVLETGVDPLFAYLKQFDKYKETLQINPIEEAEKVDKEESFKEVQDIKDMIAKLEKKEMSLREEISKTVQVSFFQVHCKDIIKLFSDRYNNLIKNLKEVIAKRARDQTQKLITNFQEIRTKLTDVPPDIEKLTEIKEYMENEIPRILEDMQVEIDKSLEMFGVLEDFNYKFPKEDLDKRWAVFSIPDKIMKKIDERKGEMNKDKNKFQQDMKIAQEEFKENIDNLERTILSFNQYQNLSNYVEVAKTVDSVNDSLKLFQDEAKKFNTREGLFGMDPTDYSKIYQMVKEFQPYSTLWTTAANWFKNIVVWMNVEWDNLDAVGAEKFVDEGLRNLSSVSRFFREREIPAILKISETVKGQLEEFRPKVPLMVALRKKGMKERHWEEISKELGLDIPYKEPGFNFTKVLELGLLTKVEKCIEVGEKASKEFHIETMLENMFQQWEKINFQMLPYKGITHIIKGYDEIQMVLDEHIINTQTMQFSQFKKPFEDQIIKWYGQLKQASDIMEEWAKFQGQWMYLQPVFDSADIAKQLPGESKKFKSVDQVWKAVITHAKNTGNVMKTCSMESLLERLQESNKSLEAVQKELNNYLEKKRDRFARFFFLSDDELLEILSQTKEPTAVQPHLKKVFENIHSIEFDERKKILAMYSAEKEKVNFEKPVDPIGKNVEDWMKDLESMMKESVRASLMRSVTDYVTTPRDQWVKKHPGQCVLNGSQVHWTAEVEEAIRKGTIGVEAYFKKLENQLTDLVVLVRQKLTKQQQVTINALIVIDVHAKDVVQKLVENKVDDIMSFEWISQLRYYVENKDCFVRCIQTNFPYGYEYLGNTLRLVITPLTDKCYMTLMGALKLNYGGAPAGPAGTGKTESTKDLAKALAKQCVVFNCSDSMDYIMVGKFFKGLASSGAWCCFDEFNRINIEVLSVIAQQLLVLFTEKSKGTKEVEFEGSKIELQPTFSVFITMNPGYAGRTELPDNLKALFRSVAMMVPDYALIGEIMLYSFGFTKGRELAKKMVATFKLSSEQLSSQYHYDYGMRAVRSVINAAGLLKVAEPDMDEQQLLLRALRDVNVPKFLKDDLPLFENIIKDLFPGVDRPQINYGNLLNAITNSCKKFSLQPVKPFIDKIIQLYDTIQVRHGLMLVGPTGGGKTWNYKVLQAAMTSLQNEGFGKVQTFILNPKSITMGQLYGQFNEQTHEWTDGILAYLVRESVRDTSGDKQWIVFDGPVDSLWIESMNTVLDDNKKLCLNSGQILTLTPLMTMMFEVEDLAEASPATVSRCGMVYMEPVSLGVEPLVESWIEKLPNNFKEKKGFEASIRGLFTNYLVASIEWVRKQAVEVVETFNNSLATSLMKILDCFLASFKDTEIKKVSVEEIENLSTLIEPFFLFSLLWSVGATGDYSTRKKFDVFFRDLMKKFAVSIPIPEKLPLYDYMFMSATKSYAPWLETIKGFEIDSKLGYNEIMIPTADSTRSIFLMKMLLTNQKHVLCPGPTGTGKSQNCYSLLTNQLGEEYQYIAITFSAQTSANQTQDSIDLKLDKRRKGFYGPPIGKKCVIFVDDMNMPKKETYGAQPPIEILRQYLDHKGWYNRKDLQFMNLEDLVILSAMGPPGGGRTRITDRMVRHFNVIAYTELDEITIKQIFSGLVNFFLKRFSEDIKSVMPMMIDSVMHVYNTVKKNLLPTPTKSHYTFNMRDISKVFQGICNASFKHTSDRVDIVRLFYHEAMRVFHDRLINEEDREYFKGLMITEFDKYGLTKDEVLNMDRIIYGDFFTGRDLDARPYYQTPDMKTLLSKMESYQEEYNEESAYSASAKGKKMKLVLFLDACEHIARITRILRQPSGNALLLGVGGSGRQSLTKLASFVAGYRLSQIEVIKGYNMRSWRDDIKEVLLSCGVQNNPRTFLFVDTQIINEQMLEDINNILNSGDVTNLYNEKDMEEITNYCKGDCIKKGLQPNRMNIFTQYLLRVRKNIHIVLAMSPMSDSFITRLRMFPSLVNCCTIDWFTEWPEEALLGVGKGAILDFAEEYGLSEKVDALVEMFKSIHKSVEKISIRYRNELRRYNYVTPTSYLELLSLYKAIYREKKSESNLSINRLKGGLERLKAANTEVEEMQVILKKMQPELELAQIETEKTMEILVVERKEADEVKKVVAKEEEEASIQQQKARELERNCEAKVADANKTLEETLIEVQKLKKEHLVEMKSLPNPPDALKVTLGGVVILNTEHIKKMGGEIVLKPDPDPKAFGKKVEDYFETAKKYLLNDPKDLLNLLKSYDKDNINPAYINKIEQKIKTHPDFSLKRASEISLATKYLFSWVDAMMTYNKVYTMTQPLRDELKEVKIVVAKSEQNLLIKKEELDRVNRKIKNLEDTYNEKIAYKEELTAKIEECQVKLERAQKLTIGLSDEKTRWAVEVGLLEEKAKFIAGNSVIAAGMVGYSGPFTLAYRQELESNWIKMLKQLNFLHSEDVTMRSFLGVPVQIQSWNISGLPKDDTSTENGIIIEKSRRWPLMIDPQNQANKFIKNLGKDKQEGLEIIKSSDQTLMKTLEKSIQFGQWVLLENVGRDLDPSLEPILLQQIVKSQGSLVIHIGDKEIAYNDKFKFFMTTTLPNPHYSPEVSVKVTIINFAITTSGLEEQMLAQIVALENPQLEQKKTEIVKRNAADKKELLNIEDSILKSLSDAKDISELLKDETLINKLSSSKKFAAEINQRMKDSKITEAQIDEARESYRPVAYRASILFFCIVDLSSVDPMYQYSLQWFTNLFIMGVENSTASNVHEIRLENLNNYFTYSLYENICRSLFERHKLLFSFMLTVKILQGNKNMDEKEWRFLLTGTTADIKIKPNPTKWISENSWADMYRQLFGMSQLDGLAGIEEYFMQNSEKFKSIFDSKDAHIEPYPEPWQSNLTEFQKIIFLKMLRSDKLVPAVKNWISSKLGKEYIIVPSFDLSKCFKDSSIITPLIFVLSAGSDPVNDFLRVAEEMSMSKRYDTISLGQGQGIKAERMIKEAVQRGNWVLLQNCHLAITWMSDLERIVEELNEGLHKDFRLWLTSMPDPRFPISVLQNGIKMTIEPPKGLRNNLLRTYNNLDDKELNDCKKSGEYKKLLFGFSLFHAIIQDRRKFGPIGWNIPYEFTTDDLIVCRRQLKIFLDDYEEIPYKVLNYLGAEINYGGRVTDERDVRLIKNILQTYVNPEVLQDNYKFSHSGLYRSIVAGEQLDYIKYISDLPLDPSPEAFGMHENADITNAQNETRTLIETILSVQPRTSSAEGKSREDIIFDIVTFVQGKTPPLFDHEQIFSDYPTNYNESMNTVLVQEVIRYNRLLEVMLISLENVKKAIRGLIVMSDDLDALANSLYDNQVPKMWAEKGFLSLKPLGSWTEDLNNRIDFLATWIAKGTPSTFWFSGFFFPQAFITGMLQNFARKYVIAIDKLSFDYIYLDHIKPDDIKEKPNDGCYIYGLFLEGARWDNTTHRLEEPQPKILFSELPMIQLLPKENRELPKDGIYNCPLYKVVSRAGTLSTTGHSTNFVMDLEIPTIEKQNTWIKAGVASFLALRY